MDIIKVTTKEQIDNLGSALTLEGLAETSYMEFLDWVNDCATLKRWVVYVTEGQTMNEIYGLTGDNRYPNNCHIVSIALDDIEHWENLITARFNIGARWLDDIVGNNVAREEEKGYTNQTEMV